MTFRTLRFARTAALFFCTLSFVSAPAIAEVRIIAPTVNSCGAWTEARRAQPARAQAYHYWVIGFLSGATYFDASGLGFLEKADGSGIQGWMDNYCKAKPLDALSDAVIALTEELMDRAKRK